MPRNGSRPPVIGLLMKYFEERPGQNVYLADLVEDLGVPEASIRNGVSNLRQRPEWKSVITSEVAGAVWRYVPKGSEKKEDSAPMFEQIGATREGDLILQDEAGILYRAKEL